MRQVPATAPAETSIMVFLAGAFSWTLAQPLDLWQAWAELFVAGLLIFLMAWTATLLHALERIDSRQRWTVTLIAAFAVAGYALLVQNFTWDAEVWRAVLFVAGVVLMLAGAPAWAGNVGSPVMALEPPDRLRVIDGRFLLRTVTAVLYGGALFAGLALALSAIDTLFELDLNDEIYGHVFIWIALVVAPAIVIGGLPDYVRPAENVDAVAGAVHRLLAFLVPPLVVLYFAILYAYAIRIGVTGEVPKNLLSPMVLAAGALAAAGLYFFEDRLWLRYAPPLFIPLGVLGIWAVVQRVDQYGWTEARLVRVAVLAVLVLLAANAVLQLLRRRRYALHVVPFTLAAVLTLAAAGPWSVLAVSRRDQSVRLERGLAAVGIDASSVKVPTSPRTVDADVYDRINGPAQYLASHFGPMALPPVLAVRADPNAGFHDIAASLGLQRAFPGPDSPRGFGAHLAEGAAVPLEGAVAHRVIVMPERDRNRRGAIAVRQDSTMLTLSLAGSLLFADLSSLVERRVGSGLDPDSELNGEAARVRVLDAEGTPRGDLVILQAMFVVTETGVELTRLEGLLVIPRTDPPR